MFFGMQAAGWRVSALLSLLIGFVGFIRLEAPGWPWAAHLALLLGFVGAIGTITQRQFVYALLSVLIGYASAFFGMKAGWPLSALFSLLIGSACPLGIITFRQLDALAPVTKIRVWSFLVMLFAVFSAGILFAGYYVVHTKVHGEGILFTDIDTLSLVRAPGTGRLVDLRVKPGDWIAPGTQIGQIAQNDLLDAISEAESRLNDLKREDRELTELEQEERQRKEAAIAQVKQAVPRAPDDSRGELNDTSAAGRTEARRGHRRARAPPRATRAREQDPARRDQARARPQEVGAHVSARQPDARPSPPDPERSRRGGPRGARPSFCFMDPGRREGQMIRDRRTIRSFSSRRAAGTT